LINSPATFAGSPTIPTSAWGWSRVSHRWPRAFVIPDLLITGGILWLVLDRTRPLWMDAWRAFA